MNIITYLEQITEDFEKIPTISQDELKKLFIFYSKLVKKIDGLDGSKSSKNTIKQQLIVLITEMRAKDTELKMKALGKTFDRKKWDYVNQLIIEKKIIK